MRHAWGIHTVEAIDYELVRVGNDPERPPVGHFADAHAVDAPLWRFVSGYLMLSAGSADGAGEVGSRLVVSSHGHAVAGLRADAAGCTLEVDDAWRLDGSVARCEAAGIAVVADAGTELDVSTDGRSLAAHSLGAGSLAARSLDAGSTDASPRPPWGVTVVHGPAPVKVENRIGQLRSLERVGGRHV